MSGHTPTPRQRDVLAWVAAYQRQAGWAPSLRELAVHFGWSSSVSGWWHLKALERKGLVRREAGHARAVSITPAGQRELEEEGT